MNIRISDLRNFEETAQKSTMSAAARHLGITQPALSESIRRLEEDLGVMLFYRSRSGIRLTPSGKDLLERARAILNGLAALQAHSKSELKANGRSILVGCHSVVASYVLPKALREFNKSVPDFKIKIYHASSRQIQSKIQSGEIDLGIVVNPHPALDLIIKNIGVDEICVWSNDNPQDKIICNTDIFQTQHILRRWKNSPKDFIESESLELISRLTAEGVGYGILPERAVKLLGFKLHKQSQLPSYKDVICTVHRPEFGKNAFEKCFIEAIRKTFS